MDILGSLGSGHLPHNSDGPQFVKCNRKGCMAEAEFEVLWNNPKIHAPERRKSWAACSEHVQYLQDFVVARGFWKETVPLG
ncbi:acetone carboxylase [Rothia nasimurium]|uniref:acetone carboxylase n=1 Tax=Rothia nasimurium TaxID=85336 RepID=UPI001F357FF0|nr:acetone carboxylase [Rothia nasimurium]